MLMQFGGQVRCDPDVTILSVQTRDGRPLALLGNYSTHYAGAPALSADYFAVFASEIRTIDRC